MCKTIVHMTDWELYASGKHYNLSGTADRHPRLGINAYVRRTSSLVSFSFEEDVLTYETRNTIYVCPLKHMSLHPYVGINPECVMHMLHRAHNSESILDQIVTASAVLSLDHIKAHICDLMSEKEITDYKKIAASLHEFLTRIRELHAVGQKELEEAEKQENENLIDIAKQYENCVYIEFSNIDYGNKIAYHLGKYTGIVKPSLHCGMFQDSVFYMKDGSESDMEDALDFRYFPRGFGNVIKTYSWSDNIKQAVIKNKCSEKIRFNNIEIEPEEVKIILPKSHSQERINPDCYNEKILFSEKAED